jgi:hypothetical protein
VHCADASTAARAFSFFVNLISSLILGQFCPRLSRRG